jgi:hypothetical protein
MTRQSTSMDCTSMTDCSGVISRAENASGLSSGAMSGLSVRSCIWLRPPYWYVSLMVLSGRAWRKSTLTDSKRYLCILLKNLLLGNCR